MPVRHCRSTSNFSVKMKLGLVYEIHWFLKNCKKVQFALRIFLTKIHEKRMPIVFALIHVRQIGKTLLSFFFVKAKIQKTLFKFNVKSKYSISLIRKWTHTGFGYLKRTFGKSFSKRVGRIFSHDWPCSTKIEEAPESEKKRRIKSPTFFHLIEQHLGGDMADSIQLLLL